MKQLPRPPAAAQTKFTWKWSDWLITLFLCLLFYFLLNKAWFNQSLHMVEEPILITVVSESQQPFIAASLQTGGLLYLKESSTPLGTIQEIQVEAAKKWVTDQDGEHHQRRVDEEQDIYIRFEANSFSSLAGRNVIDQSFIYVNQYLPLETKQVVFPAKVLSLQRKVES